MPAPGSPRSSPACFLLVLVVGFGDVVALIPMAALVAVMVMVSVGHVRLALDPAHDAAPDAEVGDRGDGRDRRLHRRDAQPRDRRGGRGARRDDALRPPGRAPDRDPPRAGRGRRRPAPRSTGSPASCSSRPATTSTPSSSTPRTPTASSSTCRTAHIWDASTVASLDAITTKYERKGKTATIVGLAGASADRHERLSGRLASH